MMKKQQEKLIALSGEDLEKKYLEIILSLEYPLKPFHVTTKDDYFVK
jgi:hypothetical protein